MKNLGMLAALCGIGLTLAALEGCGSSSSGSDTSSSSGTSKSSSTTEGTGGGGTGGSGTGGEATGGTGGGSNMPAPPVLGDQIDRMGRPAINTALNHTFDSDSTAKETAKEAWNQAKDPSTWASTFAGEAAKNLAILDGLDGVCGNQLLAAPVSGGTVPPTRYATLGAALTADVLWLNTEGTTATTYLAVEVNALGLQTNTDQGGRTLNYDVIDTSYSALAAGAFSGVSDGVNGNDVTVSTTFPYLAAPH